MANFEDFVLLAFLERSMDMEWVWGGTAACLATQSQAHGTGIS